MEFLELDQGTDPRLREGHPPQPRRRDRALEPAPDDALGAALAAAFAAKSKPLVDAFSAGARRRPKRNAALTAAALMGMNNVWYPFVEMAGRRGPEDAARPSCA